MEIQNAPKNVKVQKINLDKMDYDFLGNPLEIGDYVIVPFKDSTMIESVFLVGKIKG